jgi:hypothetical protein
MKTIYEELNKLIDKINAIEFDGVNNVSIPDVVQVKYDSNTNTSYVVYNEYEYQSFEDCLNVNDDVAEDYYCLLETYYNELIADDN